MIGTPDKKRAEAVLEAPSGPDRSNPSKEGNTMADRDQYSDSNHTDNAECPGNWRSIGAIAAGMVETSPAMEAITDILAIYELGTVMGLSVEDMDAAIHEHQPMDQDAVMRAFETKADEVAA